MQCQAWPVYMGTKSHGNNDGEGMSRGRMKARQSRQKYSALPSLLKFARHDETVLVRCAEFRTDIYKGSAGRFCALCYRMLPLSFRLASENRVPHAGWAVLGTNFV